MKRCKLLVLLAALLLCLAPVQTLAAGRIDMSADVSLTVTAFYDGKAVAGMQFDAYLIANVDDCGELTVLERYGDFAEELDIRGRNDEAWQKMVTVLEREIRLDTGLKPTRSAVTDAHGTARFTDIPMGLYLVTGHSVQQDNQVYSAAPFFVMLPEQELTSNTWSYHIVATVKVEQNPVRRDYTVVKVWEDDCHAAQRPKSIAVQLMCDGKPYGDPVTLPENGRWSHTWKNLDVDHYWTVTETRQSGYAVPKVTASGTTFIVTNTCDKPTPTPGGSTPDTPSTLPQTGQLWWPVPLLLCAGMGCVIVGLLRRRGDRHDA